MTQIDVEIGGNVLALRKAKELTQEEVAGVLGVSRESIANKEMGRQGFTAKDIYLLCSIFNCTPNDLFPAIKFANVKKQKRKVIISRQEIKKEFVISGVPKIKK